MEQKAISGTSSQLILLPAHSVPWHDKLPSSTE